VSFLFTDVEGSTRLWTADRLAMSASLALHDEILRAAIESVDGYVFSIAGDSFAAAFRRVAAAVAAARRAQDSLTAAAWPGPALRVRMGLHLGEAEERGGDYFGSAVNTAARVAAAGHGGQVLLTDGVRAIADVAAVDLGVHRLRDVAEPLRIFQLGDGRFPALRVVDPRSSNLPVRPTRIIGRDEELLDVRKLMAGNRLVTITAVAVLGAAPADVRTGPALVVAVGLPRAARAHRPPRPSRGRPAVRLWTDRSEPSVPAQMAVALVKFTAGAGVATAWRSRYRRGPVEARVRTVGG
jgi:hypothetical protein